MFEEFIFASQQMPTCCYAGLLQHCICTRVHLQCMLLHFAAQCTAVGT